MISTNHIYSRSHIQCDTEKCHLERQVLTPFYYGIAETVGVINFYLYCDESKQNSKSHLANYWLFRAMKPLQNTWVYITGMIKALMKLLHAETTGLLRENYKNKWVPSSDSAKNGSLLVFFDCLLISHDGAPCGIPLTNFTKARFLLCKLVKQSPACDLFNGTLYPTVLSYYFKRSRCFLILKSNDWTSWVLLWIHSI